MPESVVIFAALESVGTVVLNEQIPTAIALPAPSPASVILADATPVILPADGSDCVTVADTPGVILLDTGEPEPPEPPQPVILSGDAGAVILNQNDSVVIISTDAPPPSTGLSLAQARKLAFLIE